MEIIDYLYKGFEDEEEISFLEKTKDDVVVCKLTIWHGYFVFLMNEVLLANKGEGLSDIATTYSLHSGWYDEDDEWECEDLKLF